MHKILVYLHIIHLLKSTTYFEHYPAHLQKVYVVTVYMQLLVSSLSVKTELSKMTVIISNAANYNTVILDNSVFTE
jgi:hypothetical protein